MLNIAIQAARRAGQIIVRALDRLDKVEVSEKSQNDFVTDIDRQAEKEILFHIKRAYPSHGILAEESGHTPGNSEDDEYTWIIDPLDGTTNFIHGIPHFAISIGIKRNNSTTYGVIYDPVRDELFTAHKGGGAFLNNHRLRIRNTPEIERALLATGLPYRSRHLLDTFMKSFTELFKKTDDIRRAGSAALDLAYVAAGRLDGYWEYELQPWDIAAGALLVKEAGGYVTDIDGGDNYLENGNIIAASPKIYPHIYKALNK